MRIIVWSTPGGGYDLIARVVARHLRKHIPGHPSIIVVNMPGAGGLIAGSYMYHRAKSDGSTLALLERTSPINQVIRTELAEKADFRSFRYLGSLMQDVSVLVIRKATGIRTMGELINSAKKFVPGATTKTSAGYRIPFALEKAWKLPFKKWVLGYRGSAQHAIAMERGETDLIQNTVDSIFGALPRLLEIGEPLVVASRKRDPRLPKVPTVFEVAQSFPPSKQFWPLVELLVNASEWGRPFVAPSGITTDRLQLLREAFSKTFEDPEMIAEANKLRLSVNPVAGKAQEDMIRRAMTPSQEMVDLLRLLRR